MNRIVISAILVAVIAVPAFAVMVDDLKENSPAAMSLESLNLEATAKKVDKQLALSAKLLAQNDTFVNKYPDSLDAK